MCPKRTPVAKALNPVVFPTPGFETYKTGKPPGPEHTARSLTSAKTKGPLAKNCRQTAVFSLQKLRQTPHKMAAAPSPYNPPQPLAPPTPGERACVTELARSRPTPKGRVPLPLGLAPPSTTQLSRPSSPRPETWFGWGCALDCFRSGSTWVKLGGNALSLWRLSAAMGGVLLNAAPLSRASGGSVSCSSARVGRTMALGCLPSAYCRTSVQFNSVQSLSRVRLFATPWIAARQASLSITNSRSLLKLMSIESVMPSNRLIICRLLLLPPSIPQLRHNHHARDKPQIGSLPGPDWCWG